MRDIKFRAWKKTDTPEMFTNITSVDFKERVIGIDFPISKQTVRADVESLDNIVLMQYTGMKDVKGVEIYEGDILQSKHYFRYQVVFKGDCWRCESLKNNRFKNRFIGRDLKVIGNIYENPELLED